jgi:Mce-associated membrane protein
MSDSRTNSGRSRRRASRLAGPPVDEPRTTAVSPPPPATGDTAAKALGATGSVAAGAVAAGAVAGGAGPAAAVPAKTVSTAAASSIPAMGEPAPPLSWAAAAGVADAEAPEAGKVYRSGVDPSVVDAVEPDAAKRDAAGQDADDAESAWTYVDLTRPRAAAPRYEVPELGDFTATLETGDRKLGAVGWTAAVAAVLALLVLVGAGGVLVYHQRHADAMAERRTQYVQTAKQAILNLTNIQDDTASADIDRVLSVASGQLKAEYSSQKDAYAKVVQQAKVKAHGEIVEAALESDDASSARVLVAATQTLTNAGSTEPQQRTYRFRVTLTRDDGGAVTASEVEFVA